MSKNPKLLCFKCKEQANIKINILKYCSNCFLDLLEQKIRKNLPKICSNMSVFFYLANTPSSLVMIDIIEKIFKSRPLKKFEIFCEDSSMYLDCFERCTYLFKANSKASDNEVIDYCTENHFDFMFYGETMNNEILKSMSFICEGKPKDAVNSILEQPSGKLTIINILLDIKAKEVMYFLYLKNTKKIFTVKEKNKMNTILADFLTDTDARNGLAFFNIKNTFKKLAEQQQPSD